MDALSQLPLECLRHILRILAQDNKQGTLAALLSVNKYFASVTLPFLYNTPFHQTSYAASKLDVENNGQTLPTATLLTKTLLSQLANLADLPKAVLMAYSLDTTSRDGRDNDNDNSSPSPLPPSLSRLEYLQHIRHLDVDHPLEGGDGWYCGPGMDFSDELCTYIQQDEFAALHRLDHIAPDELLNFPRKSTLIRCLWVVLRREVSWALARPILKQLQSLAIPLSSLNRYAGVVDRLGSLEHIRFFLDEIYISRYSDEVFLRNRLARFDQAMSMMLQFVKDHVRLFKGNLKSIDFSFDLTQSSKSPYPLEIQRKILQLLPPLHKPTQLAPSNWAQFALHPFSTDLGSVVKVSRLDPPGPWYDIFCQNPELLQKCRSLETLALTSLGQGSFNWSVQEKKNAMRSFGCGNTTMTATTTTTAATVLGDPSHGQGAAEQSGWEDHGLVPLSDVRFLEGSITPFTDEIDDVITAFGQTLQRIYIETSDTHPPRSFLIGQGWVDPLVLTHIEVKAKYNRLLVAADLYMRLPSLISIDLWDETFEYQCQDILASSCQPGHLAKVEVLRLQGWPALTFHLATLKSTTQLRRLQLSTRQESNNCFIAPVDELNQVQCSDTDQDDSVDGGEGGFVAGDSYNLPRRRLPHWSWDWHLPHLRDLYLTGEVAYRFEFRMLQECPALVYFILGIQTAQGDHKRVISRKDLFIPNNNNSSSSSSIAGLGLDPSGPSQRIVAPTLAMLSMKGAWVMEDDELLAEFLTGMFPNLMSLSEVGGWCGETIGGLIKVVQKPDMQDPGRVFVPVFAF
ncbi:hypothetical protein BG015_007271 [Linnemannia schmuckeri]|uniref:F-box domain-containing protein n=1 Tax=Linnemannia schmuckeri TaxID=64567 RepID=A0A9P5S657_9FUNG|nr:hypothetical protein BG015_007271 [Linnemannia schmuckeri]